MTVKARLHQAVDELTDGQAEAALRRIDALRSDPLVQFLDSAPVDDEPVSDEERAAVAEAEAARVAGISSIPLDEIKRKFDPA